jgi:carboxyl-terminal processing protease
VTPERGRLAFMALTRLEPIPPERSLVERVLALVTAVAVVVLLTAGIAVASYRFGLQQGPDAATTLPSDFTAIDELYRQITEDSVRLPDAGELLYGALEGMLGALEDPYARFYAPDAYAEMTEWIEGRFGGVGLLLEQTPDGLLVVTALPDTPAGEAGIQPGERLVSVDGRDVRDADIEFVVELVRGEEGTSVTLGFEGGPAGTREVTLVRAEIEMPITEARLLEDGMGYVRLLQFPQGAGQRLETEVARLVEQGADGLVLDLRGNPGGLLRESVSVASVFLSDVPVVQVKERVGEVRTLRARSGPFTDLPLVVLVDKGTASAAEIVAAALQHHNRGELVGTDTFGKGTVQTVRQLTIGAGIKYTTSEFFTPDGTSLEGVGVRPDRVVADADDQLAEAQALLRAQLASDMAA